MSSEQVRILFLAANPKSTPQLDLNAEFEAIEEQLNATRHTNSFLLQHRWKLSSEQLLDFLLKYRPHILHFSGHGVEDNLILLDRDGNPWSLDRRLARQAFSSAKDTLKLVVLNACFSRDVAEDVSEVIDCVIGMALPVRDNTAVTFSSALYRGIGQGLSVREAFNSARTAIEMSGLDGERTPQILSKPGVDPRRMQPLEWIGAAPPATAKDKEPPPAQNPPRTLPLNPIDRPTLRRELHKHLPTDGQFQEFVQDYFEDVARRFSGGMDRLSRTNLLLSMKEPSEIAAALEKYRQSAG